VALYMVSVCIYMYACIDDVQWWDVNK